MKKNIPVVFFLLQYSVLSSFYSQAQLFNNNKHFSRADTLRGSLSPLRSCFDVTYYHLDIRIDTMNESLSGYNDIWFKVTENTSRLQLDLFSNMEIRKVMLDDSVETGISREFNAFFVDLPGTLFSGSRHHLTVYYGGSPQIGKMLPWDGGFKWTKDQDGNPWIAVACQGKGASLWWPNKDHQSDEPDSMLISVSVPSGLMEVSNGRLRNKKELRGGFTRYDWFVSKPVNNYNVTINIGNYVHFNDVYVNGSDSLTLDYYVMPYNLEKAKKQFSQVKPMLSCFERYFGKYPFYADGYKLVEAPYLGMEHQSCVAYGNRYQNGYFGMDYSGAGIEFDYIIIHESAHEWWGNSITTCDIADMWVHEGFASYAEVLYTECMYDSAKAAAYIRGQEKKIGNREPVIGPYGVNEEGSGDMYPKGLALLSTLRNVIRNDSMWFDILKGLQHEFRYQTVTSAQVEAFISQRARMDLKYVFDQYLRSTKIPVLEIRHAEGSGEGMLEFRWNGVVDGFNMPVLAMIASNSSILIHPTMEWQQLKSSLSMQDTFKNTDRLFYIKLKME